MNGRMPRAQRAPAADRNTEPILSVLKAHLPERGRALEIAGGTGQHAAAFARAFPGITWVASDPDATACESIAAWVEETGLANLSGPLDIDVTQPDWHAKADAAGGPFDVILAINLVHIAPWEAAQGLVRGAGALLPAGGLLYLYGPYKRDGAHTAGSNAAFDESLRARDPAWGVRDIGDVAGAARPHGLDLEETVPMPTNNFSLVFRKR